jgi:hypothetical protein
MGSGLFVFLFIASAVLNSGATLGGGESTAEQLAEKGQFGAAVNALASDAAKRADSATAATAPPPAVPAAAGGTAAQTPGSASSAAPTAAVAAVSSPAPAPATVEGARTFGPPPQLFLLIAVLFAFAAFVAHRRLRRV